MVITDIIVLALSVLYLARGFARGFLRSVLFPLSFIMATIIGVGYFQIFHDFLISLLIALLGPFLLYFFLIFLFNFFRKNAYSMEEPNILSRLAGALISLVWIWAFIVPTIMVLAFMPANNESLIKLHKDLARSVSYKKIAEYSNNMLPSQPAIEQPKARDIHQTPPSNLQSLSTNPRFQKLLQDPEIQQQVESHDIAKLMSNPKIIALSQQILSNPEMAKMFIEIWRNQTRSLQNK